MNNNRTKMSSARINSTGNIYFPTISADTRFVTIRETPYPQINHPNSQQIQQRFYHHTPTHSRPVLMESTNTRNVQRQHVPVRTEDKNVNSSALSRTSIYFEPTQPASSMQQNLTSPLTLMPPPQSNKRLNNTMSTTNNKSQSKENENKTVANQRNVNEKVRIFTGNVDKVIKWNKVYNEHFCFYEVIGAIVSLQEGTVALQKVLLLRDKKGPILRIVHYLNDHICIENFFVGQMLRCVGRMIGPNMMHGLSIREAKHEEISTLQRMCYVSDHAISKIFMKF